MSVVDFNLLRRRIADAANRTFDAVRTAHPAEHPYAFALYTVEDAVGIVPSLNTEEAYGRAVAKRSADKSFTRSLTSANISLERSLLGDYRWSPFEWACESAALEAFVALCEMISDRGAPIYDENDALGFERFRAGVMASMVLGLQDLRSAGRFGGGNVPAVTLFCSVAGSEDAIWLEEDSATRLNEPAAFGVFYKQRVKYIAGSATGGEIDPDSVRGLYLRHIEAAPGAV